MRSLQTSYAAVPLPPPAQPVPLGATQNKRKREEAAEVTEVVPIGSRKPGKKERPAKALKADKEATAGTPPAGSGVGAKEAVNAAATVATTAPMHQPAQQSKRKANATTQDDVDEDEIENLVHESLLPEKVASAKTGKGGKKKAKWVPENESSADRDRRTIFVGNVNVQVAKSQACHGLAAAQVALADEHLTRSH